MATTPGQLVAASLAWWQAEELRMQALAVAGGTALMDFTHQGQSFNFAGYMRLIREMIEFWSGKAGQQAGGPFTITEYR